MSTFRYRKVDAGTWGDERFKALSPDGKLLWFYLLTGPDVTSVPGLIVAGRAHLCEVFEWDAKRFDSAFKELGQVDDEGTPMAKADWSARVIWLPKAWKHNRPSNVATARSWLGHLSVVPGCALKREAVLVLAASLESFGEPYEVISRTIRERFANRSPVPVPVPVSPERVQGEPTDEPEAYPARSSDAHLEQDLNASVAKATREQDYQRSYETGIAKGKGGPYAMPNAQRGELHQALLTFAKWGPTNECGRPPGSAIRGDDLVEWIAVYAEDFAAWVVKQPDEKTVSFYSAFGPRGFAKWLNETSLKREAKRVG